MNFFMLIWGFLKNNIELLTLVMTLYIGYATFKNNKKNIEFEKIYVNKIERITTFLDFFFTYLHESITIKNKLEDSSLLEEEKIKLKNIQSSMSMNLRIQMSKFSVTLILFNNDGIILKFKEFQQLILKDINKKGVTDTSKKEVLKKFMEVIDLLRKDLGNETNLEIETYIKILANEKD